MLQVPDRFKPTQGFSHAFHLAFNGLLPILAYILVRIDFAGLAILLVIISKWRMFAVRPRYWLANVISSSVDILVGVSFVLFMANTSVAWWQIFWALLYAGWLIGLKPRSDVLSVSGQAMLGQLLGLTVLYFKFGDSALAWLVAGTWIITYLAARHFFTSFDEPQFALLSHLWAWFAASLAFILGHWLLFYGTIAQIIVLLTTIGYGLAAIYYLHATDKLTTVIQRQLLAIMVAILIIVLLFSDWTGATV